MFHYFRSTILFVFKIKFRIINVRTLGMNISKVLSRLEKKDCIPYKMCKILRKNTISHCCIVQNTCATYTRYLKITEKVSFNIASEASCVYILSGQKLIKNAKNGPIWQVFENLKLAVKKSYQTGQF